MCSSKFFTGLQMGSLRMSEFYNEPAVRNLLSQNFSLLCGLPNIDVCTEIACQPLSDHVLSPWSQRHWWLISTPNHHGRSVNLLQQYYIKLDIWLFILPTLIANKQKQILLDLYLMNSRYTKTDQHSKADQWHFPMHQHWSNCIISMKMKI